MLFRSHGPTVRGPDGMMAPYYVAVLPDGRKSPTAFNDELEAAIWALGVLDPPSPPKPIEGFALLPENEQ